MSDAPRPGPLLAGPAPLPPASQRRRTPLRRAAYAVGARVMLLLARGLWATLRVRVEGQDALDARLAGGAPLVLAFWHDQLVPAVLFLHARVRRAGGRLAFLVSPSVDGDAVARAVELSGGAVVRGSATRSGVKSLRDLYRLMRRDGASPVITPDGPRGPRRECKAGPLMLAQLARAPVVPLACSVRPAWRLSTWDRLALPLPFARVVVQVGAPLESPAPDDAAALEAERAALQRSLDALTAAAGG